ncbi:MAG TPA: hypothetical protein PKO15_08280 [Fibrobacteria bacterium]|nr:hypothetical protein [Fibrobacteria bacterium]
MNSSLKSTIATAIAIVADVTAVAQAGPAVFLRGDSIDVATDQAVYRVSRRDSVAVPWLESDRIRQICGTPHWVDASGGRLYAWGDKGLCLAGPAGVRKILAFGSGAAGIVQRVEVDPLGRVAVQFRNGQWQTAQDTGGDFRSGAPDTVSRDGVVYSPGDGNYWRVQGNLLIHRKVDGRSDSVSLPSGMDVYALAQDSSGWVLVTDWMDLYGSRKGRWAKLSIPSGEAGSLRQILSDPAGGTWVLTQRSLYRFQDSSLVRFAQARPGSSPWNALAVDSSGVPWVVTEAGDLLHPQGDRWAEIRVSLRKPPDPKVRLWRHGMLPDLLEPVLVAIPGPHGGSGRRVVRGSCNGNPIPSPW